MAEFDFDAVVVGAGAGGRARGPALCPRGRAVGVVGAGAVGLACGYALTRRGLTVVVLEQEAAIGQGVSSRNSEVIHGGLYYPTGALKARFRGAGRRALSPLFGKHHG